MIDPQPNPERTLDQTLHHLATQPIPEGLEARLRARLAEASLKPPTPNPIWRTLRRTLLPSTLTLAAAALLLTIARHPHPATSTTNLAVAPTPRPPSTTSTLNRTPVAAHPHTTPRIATPTHPDPDAALALAESNAPSQLAPDLPLTDDERALQHLARHPSPDSLNALNPALSAAEQLAQNAAFQAFFTHPAIPERILKGESN